jgi:hypothetical protein
MLSWVLTQDSHRCCPHSQRIEEMLYQLALLQISRHRFQHAVQNHDAPLHLFRLYPTLAREKRLL